MVTPPAELTPRQKRVLNVVGVGVFVLALSALLIVMPLSAASGTAELVFLALVVGVPGLVAWTRWHALWLFPGGLLVFAALYQWTLWDGDRSAANWFDATPVNVAQLWIVIAAVPLLLLLVVRWLIVRKRPAPQRPPSRWPSKDPAAYR
jgi:hypothetical protein